MADAAGCRPKIIAWNLSGVEEQGDDHQGQNPNRNLCGAGHRTIILDAHQPFEVEI